MGVTVRKIVKVGGIVSGMAAMAFATMGAAAPPQRNAGATQVIVAKDISKSANYMWTYKIYNKAHKLIATKEIKPPAGSLVQFVIEPLAKAEAQHATYFLVSKSQSLAAQFDQLHAKLFKAENPNFSQTKLSAQISNALISPNTITGGSGSYTASGTFDVYTSPTSTIYYAVDYTDNGSNVSVSNFQTSETSGTLPVYQNSISWDGNSYSWSPNDPQIPSGSFASFSWPLAWSGYDGNPFTTEVVGSNGVYYSGYVTLTT